MERLVFILLPWHCFSFQCSLAYTLQRLVQADYKHFYFKKTNCIKTWFWAMLDKQELSIKPELINVYLFEPLEPRSSAVTSLLLFMSTKQWEIQVFQNQEWIPSALLFCSTDLTFPQPISPQDKIFHCYNSLPVKSFFSHSFQVSIFTQINLCQSFVGLSSMNTMWFMVVIASVFIRLFL